MAGGGRSCFYCQFTGSVAGTAGKPSSEGAPSRGVPSGRPMGPSGRYLKLAPKKDLRAGSRYAIFKLYRATKRDVGLRQPYPALTGSTATPGSVTLSQPGVTREP